MLQKAYLPQHFSVAIIIGILLGFFYNWPISNLFIGLLISIALLIFFEALTRKRYQPPYLFSMVTFLIFVQLGMLQITLQKASHKSVAYLKERHLKRIELVEERKSNTYFRSFLGVATSESETIKTKVLVQIRKPLSDNLVVGDHLLTYSTLQELPNAKNPGGFDYGTFLKRRNIQGQFVFYEPHFVIESKQPNVWQLLYQKRNELISQLNAIGFKPEVKAIYSAIILGQKSELSKSQYQAYKDAGAAHLLAVSGLHIGVVLWLINLCLWPLTRFRHGKLIRLCLALMVLWLYAIFIGLSPSVLRSVVMFSAVAIGWFLGKESKGLQSLYLSLFVLLLWHPWYIFDVGFQLSYLAVFSILKWQPLMMHWWLPKHRIAKYFWQIFTVSLVAQLGIAPLCLFYFNQIPTLFWLVSLIIIPVLGLILGLGLLLGIFSLYHIEWQPLIITVHWLLDTMNKTTVIFAQQELFLFKEVHLTWYQAGIIVILTWFIYGYLKRQRYTYLLVALFGVMMLQTSFILQVIKQKETNELVIFHQIRGSHLLFRNGLQAESYGVTSTKSSHYIEQYQQQFKALKIDHNQDKEVFHFKNQTLLVVDSNAIYKPIDKSIDLVLLKNSPKIHLDRLINQFKPKVIIADGSNYNFAIKRWQQTCLRRKIKFHSTRASGAFRQEF